MIARKKAICPGALPIDAAACDAETAPNGSRSDRWSPALFEGWPRGTKLEWRPAGVELGATQRLWQMHQPMFSIVLERSDLLIITLSGFWQEEEMAAFEDAIRANLKALRRRSGFDVIADLTDFPPQSQDIVKRHQTVIDELRASGLRKAANVVGPVLTRLQLKRINSIEDNRQFENMAEARQWINAA